MVIMLSKIHVCILSTELLAMPPPPCLLDENDNVHSTYYMVEWHKYLEPNTIQI